MNVIGNPGVEKVDFELWSLAVSAINGCGQCLDSHEQVLRKAGVDRETIQEAVKIASVIQAVGVTSTPRPYSPSSDTAPPLTHLGSGKSPGTAVPGALPRVPCRCATPAAAGSPAGVRPALPAGRGRGRGTGERRGHRQGGGPALSAAFAGLPVRAQIADHGVDHGDQRYGDHRAPDARDEPAGRHREDHRERVHPDGAAEDERLEDVALDLLHRQDHSPAPTARSRRLR